MERLGAIGSWLRRRANDVAVALMALMFVSFLLQIGFRYFLNQPLGWTDEVTVLCWLWAILWCSAFVLSDRDEIRFDILYSLVPAGVQRAFTVVYSVAIVGLFAVALPGTWSYVTFMKREHTAYLQMRLDLLYAIYLVFAVAVICRYGRLAWRAATGAPLDTASAPDQAT